MAKQVDFFDGAQSSTTPTIGNVDTTNLACYADDTAYEAANAGAPTEGNIYCNTTDNVIRYYNGTEWTTLADDGSVQTFTNKTIDGTDATGTNTITNDATDVTYDNTTSGLAAGTAQAAIDEVEGRLDTAEADITTAQGSADANTTDIADIRTTTGTADGDTDMGIFTGSTLSDNSDLRTLLQEIEDAVEAVGGALVFAGTWDANANSPALSDGTGTQGEFYIVSTAGTTSLDGISDWSVNDWAIFDGTVWRKIDNSELVTEVNGQTGNVSLDLNDLADVNDGGVAARYRLQRNSLNTLWIDFNPYSNQTDTTSGSNATLSSITEEQAKRLTNGGLVSIDMIPASFQGDTFVMLNDTGNPVTLNNDTGATSADRILTGSGGPITLKDGASIALLYDANVSVQKWRVIGGPGGGEGGLSGIVTGDNSTADTTTGDWAAYSDAAQNTPEDGTGGSPNITITRNSNSSELLQGSGSFEIAKGAFDRQGEGVSLDLEVPKYIRGQASQIQFSYEATVDFNFGSAADPVGNPSDIQVFLYDVTNSKIISTNNPYITGGGLYRANVQIPSDCEDVRVILHVATDNALAYEFRFDRVQLDVAPNGLFTRANTIETKTLLSDITSGQTLTDLTFDNLIVGKYYRVNLQVFHESVSSTGASALDIVHDSVVIAESRYDTVASSNNGRQVSSTTLVFKATDTSLTFVSGHTSSSDRILGDGTQEETFAQLETLNNYEDVEVAAASGLNAQAVFVGSQTSQAVTGSTTDITYVADKDTVGGWLTNQYEVKSPGDYNVSGFQQGSTSNRGIVYLNGSFFGAFNSSSTSGFSTGAMVLPDLKYGDLISFRNSSNTTISNSSVFIYKIGSEQQPYAPRVAYLKDVKAQNTAGGTFTQGAWQTRDLNTLSGDQSFISNSANQFTLQPGTYHIDVSAPAYDCNRHKLKLRNITDASDILFGKSAYSVNSAAPSQANAVLEDTFTITSAKTFEIQHYCGATQLTNGFGVESNIAGAPEIYTEVKLTKVL